MRYLVVGVLAFACICRADTEFAAPNDRGVSFAHVHLVVADIELHKKLWPELFGAELVERQGYSAVRVANALVFFRDGEPAASSAETAMDHFGLTVRDLEDVLSSWRALGYSVDSVTTSENGRPSATITMPGGVRLVLSEDPEQPARTAMGHLHFAAPGAATLMDWYAEHFGASASAHDDGRLAAVPGSGLCFEDAETDRLPTAGAAIDHIGFEVQEWDAFVEKIEDAGIRFEFGPAYIESLDLWVAFFSDPSGVLVEITHGLNRF